MNMCIRRKYELVFKTYMWHIKRKYCVYKTMYDFYMTYTAYIECIYVWQQPWRNIDCNFGVIVKAIDA